MTVRLATDLLDAENPGGDACEIIFGDVVHNRASLRAAARAVAAGLQDAGLDPGDRVAVLCAGRMEVLELFFGVAFAGGINVVLNSFLKGDMLVHQLELTSPRFLLVDAPGLGTAMAVTNRLAHPPQLIVLDGAGRWLLPWSAVRSGNDVPSRTDTSEEHPVSIVFTSGTTGRSKGCVLSHRYFVECGARIVQHFPLDVGEVQYTTYPLFHIGGQCSSLGHSLLSGASIAYDTEFRASTFWDRVRSLGATYSQATGAIGMALLAQPPSAGDLDHPLRRASWIPMAAEPQEAFEKRFGVAVSSQFYGQTEMSPVCISPSGRARSLGTMGVPLSDVEVRVVRDDDEPVAAGVPGELLLRPLRPRIMFSGYWAEPQRTVDVWRDLWYRTGDIVMEESDGSLSFVDRKSDAVRRAGENVSCFEVEQVLLMLPGITRVAVHAVPSQLIEDEIKAWVVTAPGAEIKPRDVFEHCATRLPYFAIPRFVEFADELKVNAMGKVDKAPLRALGLTREEHDLKAMGFVLSRSERR